MNTYLMQKMIDERRDDLVRMAHAGRPAPEAPAGPWRRAAGRALVAVGLRLGAPGGASGAARAQARRLLDQGDLAPTRLPSLADPAGAC